MAPEVFSRCIPARACTRRLSLSLTHTHTLSLSLSLARSLCLSVSLRGANGSQVGSRLYMAPEILFMKDKGAYCAKADLWSVGCIMYELLHGRAPYGAKPGGTETDLKRDIKADAKFSRDPPVHVSEACNDLYTGLLHQSPDRRLGYDQLFDHRWLATRAPAPSPQALPGPSAGPSAAPPQPPPAAAASAAPSAGQRVIAGRFLFVAGAPSLAHGSFASVPFPPSLSLPPSHPALSHPHSPSLRSLSHTLTLCSLTLSHTRKLTTRVYTHR